MGIESLPTTRGASERDHLIGVWAPNRFLVIARPDGAACPVPERRDVPADTTPVVRRPRRRPAAPRGGFIRQVTNTRRPPSTHQPEQRTHSAHGLLVEYQLALVDAVETTIALGLRSARADALARERVTAAWRDPLTMVAAEYLAERLAGQALHGRPTVNLSALKRALRPYANLVAAAAQAEMALS